MITELPAPSALRRFRKADLLEIQRAMAFRCGYVEMDESDTKEKIARFIENHWQAHQDEMQYADIAENERIDEVTPEGVWLERIDASGDGTEDYRFLPRQSETDATLSTAAMTAGRLDRPSAFRCYRDLVFLAGSTGDSRLSSASQMLSSYLKDSTVGATV